MFDSPIVSKKEPRLAQFPSTDCQEQFSQKLILSSSSYNTSGTLQLETGKVDR
jgi:hypothetical protein